MDEKKLLAALVLGFGVYYLFTAQQTEKQTGRKTGWTPPKLAKHELGEPKAGDLGKIRQGPSEKAFCACVNDASKCDECFNCILQNKTKVAEGVTVPSQCVGVCDQYNLTFLQDPKRDLCGGAFNVQKDIAQMYTPKEQHIVGGVQLGSNRKYPPNDMATPLAMEADPKFHRTAAGWRPMEAIRGPAGHYVSDGSFSFESTLFHHQTAQTRK